MKMFKKVLFGAMIAAPLLMTPATTKAGPIGDLLKEIFGGLDRNNPGRNNPTTPQQPTNTGNPGTTGTATGNSVPINGGLVMLLAAGLGLGAKVIYENKLRKTVPAVI